MPTGHIMMAMTLDGFVARPDHNLDWLMIQDTGNEDHGFAEFQDSMDVIVMGSGSLKTVLGFEEWPYQKPVVVLSRSMSQDDLPENLRDKIEFSQLPPRELMASFQARGFDRVYVDGGAIIRSFLSDGLVADMKIAIVPILIGQGIRIFGNLDRDLDLELLGTEAFNSGLVELRYRVK